MNIFRYPIRNESMIIMGDIKKAMKSVPKKWEYINFGRCHAMCISDVFIKGNS